MDRFRCMNPFAKRDEHSPRAVLIYKLLTAGAWLLALLTSIYYAYDYPAGRHGDAARRIWDQNYFHFSAFTMNSTVGSLYWLVLFASQVCYLGHLFSSNASNVNAACSVGSHFILYNLLHTAWAVVFVRGHLVCAEVLVVVNFLNLASLYMRHPAYPRLVHYPAVSGPLAWYFVAIYWNGAMMVPHPQMLAARIVANVFIWSILAYGLFFIALYKDYTMGFCLTALSVAIAMAQFSRQIIALQWIFATVIAALLLLATLAVALPAWAGRQSFWRREEERPLLADDA
jgi:hypothetical protein